jgi:PTH1 family peptidyl-tRNA hydrolase
MDRLLLGLGNPGETYRETRHNVGFRVIEELARRLGAPLDREECNSRVGRLVRPDGLVVLAQPQTYMNRSGYAARCFVEHLGIEPVNVLVVYDEIHLPLGKLRLRPAGSPAGHRGIESILENLRTSEVPRLRLGVGGPDGPPAGGQELVEYVLAPFAPEEREGVEAMILRAADACEGWIEGGLQDVMSRHNG